MALAADVIWIKKENEKKRTIKFYLFFIFYRGPY